MSCLWRCCGGMRLCFENTRVLVQLPVELLWAQAEEVGAELPNIFMASLQGSLKLWRGRVSKANQSSNWKGFLLEFHWHQQICRRHPDSDNYKLGDHPVLSHFFTYSVTLNTSLVLKCASCKRHLVFSTESHTRVTSDSKSSIAVIHNSMYKDQRYTNTSTAQY